MSNHYQSSLKDGKITLVVNDSISIDQIYILNALAVAKGMLSDKVFIKVKDASDNVTDKIKGNLRAQEYYWASVKKLAFVGYNQKLILETPLLFENTGRVENSFNAMVLMSRACLDSLFCTINLIYGKKLKEEKVRPLENEFLDTVGHKQIKDILLEKKNKWKELDMYRNLIIHRSAVMVIPFGPNPKGPSPINFFGIVKDRHTFILNTSNPNKLGRMILRVEKKIDEIEKLTEDTFLKISKAFN